MPSRYVATTTPDGRRVGILDRDLYAWCTLVDENKNVWPLEWNSRAAAEAWLQRCYRTWYLWERDGGGTPPKDWRPYRPESSPWIVS